MADNALLFDGTDDHVSLGSPAVFDDMAAFTIFVLYRGTAHDTYDSLVGKMDGGDNTGWHLRGWFNGDFAFTHRRPTTDTFYETGTTLSVGTNTSTWYWIVAAYNRDAGSSRVSIMGSTFGASLATETGYATATDGTGTPGSDASNNVHIGRHPDGTNYWGGGIAFVGIVGSTLNLSGAQAVVDDMQGASWLTAVRLGNSGAGTAVDEAGNASITVTGSPTLITDAPDYWTGGTSTTPRKAYHYRRLAAL
jgi:hypothetical protein